MALRAFCRLRCERKALRFALGSDRTAAGLGVAVLPHGRLAGDGTKPTGRARTASMPRSPCVGLRVASMTPALRSGSRRARRRA